MSRSKKTHIAEMLLEKELITQEQLDAAVEKQKNSDKKIGEILVDHGFIDESKLLELLSEQLDVPYINLKSYLIQPDIVKLLPEFYARHFRSIVLSKEEQDYFVGMADPQDLLAQEEIERILKQKIRIALIREDDLLSVLDTIYRHSEEISHFAETLSAEMKPNNLDIFNQVQDFSSEDMPVVNLLRSIFEDAVQINASDIHIEPDENVLRIRLRVDGVLQEQIVEEKSISQALVQRIKLIAGLNIAEKRLPQDGRFSITVKHKNFDVRVSTIPVQFGESLVMRLLNQSADLLRLSQTGMPDLVYKQFNDVLHATYGLMLIVGPTGSGKTTTLYAALNELNKAESKIITVEDPVEYRIARINQVQVNAKIDLTFANVLRSILRQDPDIIMIGELRDHETAEIAMRAAMTGHFVLATLHTNDTISSATRLLDMGIEGYLVASVLRGILAQRLVRRICEHCIVEDPLDTTERIWLKSVANGAFANHTFKKGKGCTYCHHTGYAGRIAVVEFLMMNEELADALRKGDVGLFHHIAIKQPGYRSLLESALDKAVEGITTIQEVITMSGRI
jgi:MSHA biogenesis protein MshE